MNIRARIILSMVALGLILLAQGKWLDDYGLRATENGLARALLTFGVSRGLNGVISVVQGTEVAVEPVGIGMTFTPGQILDPVNDLVERFSTVVLFAGTAFGVQRIALEVSADSLYSWATTLAILVSLTLLWGERIRWLTACPMAIKNAIFKLTLVLVIVRFAVPLLALGSEMFYQHFLQPQFVESSEQLSLTSAELNDMQTEVPNNSSGEEPSLLDQARQMVQSARQSLNVEQHLESFKQAAESISAHVLRLMVVFVFQTLVVPLLSLWLTLKLIRAVLSWRLLSQPTG